MEESRYTGSLELIMLNFRFARTLRFILYVLVTYAFHSESTLYSSQFGQLAKWLNVRLRTKWFWIPVQLQSLLRFTMVNFLIYEIA